MIPRFARKARLPVASFIQTPAKRTPIQPSSRQSSSSSSSSSMARDYKEALEKLALLQSNRIITSLFEPSSSSEKKSPQDLNAAAIPEMLAWLRRAGYTPQDLARMRHIHVAGTKGKGSVCAYATAMLAKYRTVGTYTSPHLVNVRERIAINGVPVGQDVFASAFFEIWDRLTDAAVKEGMAAAEAEGPASKPFYFRFLTILAWHIFLKEGIKDVVIECGIGGEYDATNVLPAEAVSAAIVAQLGIDHVAMLGDTVEKITWHKAGILKPGVKGFTMKLDGQPGVMEVLRGRAAERGAELVEVDEADVEQWGGVSGILKGDFQKRNQALAVMAVREHLGMVESRPLEHIPEKMIQGLKEARLRGRCEVVDDGTAQWLLDGAHTKESLEEVAKWSVQHHSTADVGSLILIFNQQERNIAQLLGDFVEAVRREAGRDDIFRHAIFTRNELAKPAEGEEARDTVVQEQAAEKMRRLVPGCDVTILDNTPDAVAEARRLAQGQAASRNKILVTGSLHLVGSILQVLEP